METSNYTTYDKPYPVFRIGLPIPDAMRNMVLLPAIFQLKTGKSFLWMGIFTNLMKK